MEIWKIYHNTYPSQLRSNSLMTNDQNLNNNLQRNIPQRNYMNNFANLSYPMNGDIQDISFKLINNENLLFFFRLRIIGRVFRIVYMVVIILLGFHFQFIINSTIITYQNNANIPYNYFFLWFTFQLGIF